MRLLREERDKRIAKTDWKHHTSINRCLENISSIALRDATCNSAEDKTDSFSELDLTSNNWVN